MMRLFIYENLINGYNRAVTYFFTGLAYGYAIGTYHLGLKETFQYYGMNPKRLTPDASRSDPILLLHGYKGNQACWLMLAKRLEQEGVGPVYTLNMEIDGWKEVLVEKIEEIRDQYHKHHDGVVNINIIGHSLGAIRAVNYVYSGEEKVRGIVFGKIISIAGRLKVTKKKASWMISNLIPMIERTYRSFRERFHLTELYTIAAERDYLVPLEAVFVNDDPKKQLYVKNRGHLSVMYSKITHDTIVNWLR